LKHRRTTCKSVKENKKEREKKKKEKKLLRKRLKILKLLDKGLFLVIRKSSAGENWWTWWTSWSTRSLFLMDHEIFLVDIVHCTTGFVPAWFETTPYPQDCMRKGGGRNGR
jgi:hypothetical protein